MGFAEKQISKLHEVALSYVVLSMLFYAIDYGKVHSGRNRMNANLTGSLWIYFWEQRWFPLRFQDIRARREKARKLYIDMYTAFAR